MDIQQMTRWDFIGLSTDEKPTPSTSSKVVDGSTFFEADTSKLNAWLENNPVTITIPINPVTYQLTPQQVLSLKGINNLSHSSQVKFWTHRDIVEQPVLLSMSNPLSFGLTLEPEEENEEMESV